MFAVERGRCRSDSNAGDRERRREFFLEGHRVGDRRRFELPLIPPPGSPYHFGGVYESSVCYPLPEVGQNN